MRGSRAGQNQATMNRKIAKKRREREGGEKKISYAPGPRWRGADQWKPGGALPPGQDKTGGALERTPFQNQVPKLSPPAAGKPLTP